MGEAMPRLSTPWFIVSKNTWYATLNGRKVSLGVKGEENEADARKAWQRLTARDAQPTPKPEAFAEPKPDRAKATFATVQAVADAFLADAEDRGSRGCLLNYRLALHAFACKHGRKQADALTVADAEAYARKPTWSPITRRQNRPCCIS